jgi:hypothetical protein
VPHLTEDMKERMREDGMPYLAEARETGNPSLAAGAIYPIKKERLLVPPFDIPDFWPRAYGLDVGWNMTAAIWGAINPANSVLYLYTEHYEGHQLPDVHAGAIKARGEWIPGVIDPASKISQIKDGDRLLEQYQGLGLKISKAINAVDAGLLAVWKMMTRGQLKVFDGSCQNWIAEHALYRRDEKGQIIKQMDHLMDATRYLVMSGLQIASTEEFIRGLNAIGGDGRPADESGY